MCRLCGSLLPSFSSWCINILAAWCVGEGQVDQLASSNHLLLGIIGLLCVLFLLRSGDLIYVVCYSVTLLNCVVLEHFNIK